MVAQRLAGACAVHFASRNRASHARRPAQAGGGEDAQLLADAHTVLLRLAAAACAALAAGPPDAAAVRVTSPRRGLRPA